MELAVANTWEVVTDGGGGIYVSDSNTGIGGESAYMIGDGGSVRATDRLTLDGELSLGNQGTGAKAGTDYLVSDRTNVYSAYTFENARSDNGISARRGNWNTGMRSRYTDTTSVYAEERYTHGDVPTGLTHAMGVDYTPDERWNLGAEEI